MTDTTRRFLTLLGHSGGSRYAMTCLYRCGNACDHPVPNALTTDEQTMLAQVRAECPHLDRLPPTSPRSRPCSCTAKASTSTPD
ncbi:hypothetical protein [Actinoplanes sp. NPDC026670]|uniref:hypothetical protein n=1 Tax=Actinoplanes sp. NPDC026670 TaxID=3154700 RepID=UPI003408AC93